MIAEIGISICVCGVIGGIGMLIRNNQVFNARMKVRNAIFKKDKNGKFINNLEIINLCHRMDSIGTYDKILFSFWKSPKSFYKDFLEEIETKNQEKEAKIK